MLCLVAGTAFSQTVNQITTVSPASAVQGATSVLVTFILSTGQPPAPPAGVMPTSVAIGSIVGSAVTHASQYTVTASFTISASEVVGSKDVTITFPTPNGTLVFSKSAGFSVTAATTNLAPSITQQPTSQSVAPGASVTFTVVASGTAPLKYLWQKNTASIAGATNASYTLTSVATGDAGSYRCVVTNGYGTATSNAATLTVNSVPTTTGAYPIVDTNQRNCYNTTAVIAAPAAGSAFYGQDAQFNGNQPSFTLSSDGLTVADNVTGLTWQRTSDSNGDSVINSSDKFTYTQAQQYPATLNAKKYGGFSDWRLPTIKELYSLFDCRGTDPTFMSGDTTGLTPFLDTNYFKFGYGDQTAGERVIDAQYASSTLYVGSSYSKQGNMLFGVNFADGRIKGYGLTMNGGSQKTFYVICVRGNTSYGVNSLSDNGDQTITDKATGLMWTKSDSGTGMLWQDALAWVQTKNATNFLGHNDWRLPNIKELQSIVDYTRSPDTTSSAAINPLFTSTSIKNEAGQTDYPYVWGSTTHAASNGAGTDADYISFGRAMGYMNSVWQDVHGAGAQRSDPKTGNPADYPQGHGPQGDAIRIYNYVRLVRTAGTATQQIVAAPTFTPTAGTSVTSVSVSIACATSGATIHYTTNGTAPTSTSAIYSTPLTFTATTTLKAYATKAGMSDSSVTSAVYTITIPQPVAAPTFSTVSSIAGKSVTVAITSATAGATIRYTTNGTTPTSTSAMYSVPLTFTATTTLKAYATKSSMTDSPVTSAVYTIIPLAFQPDLAICNYGETTYTGLGILNLDATNQTKSQTPVSGTMVHYLFLVKNTGNTADTFNLTCPLPAGSGWTIQFVDRSTGKDITTAVTTTGGKTALLAPGAMALYTLHVTPTTLAVAKSPYPLLVTGTSSGDKTKKDAVKAVTTKQ